MAAGALIYVGVLAAVAVQPEGPGNIDFSGEARPGLLGPLMAALTVAVLVGFEVALAVIQVRDLVRDVRKRRVERKRQERRDAMLEGYLAPRPAPVVNRAA